MNIYGELKKNSIRLKINTEEIEIKVRPDFYSKIKGTESFQMFLDATTSNKIKEFIAQHRKRFGFFKIVEYMFLRNRVLLLVDRDVQSLMTIRLIHAYATLALDARLVFILRKPSDFNHNLEIIENLKESDLMQAAFDKETLISKL